MVPRIGLLDELHQWESLLRIELSKVLPPPALLANLEREVYSAKTKVLLTRDDVIKKTNYCNSSNQEAESLYTKTWELES
jgi:hypothetical protein